MFSVDVFISNFGRLLSSNFLEECKFILKEKKRPECITGKIKISSDDSEENR